MTQIVGIEDVQQTEFREEMEGGAIRRTNMIDSNIANMPLVFKIQYDPNRISRPHFHSEDQFQVVLAGEGRLGRHQLKPYSVHFAKANTAYGPLVAGAGSEGLTFLTLRTRPTRGAFRLPESGQLLKTMANRRPWQTTYTELFSTTGAATTQRGAAFISPIDVFNNGEGLSVHTLILGPNAALSAPTAQDGDGQFIVIVEGGLVRGEATMVAPVVVLVGTTEEPFRVCAGNTGMKALVLNFPRVTKPN